MPFGKELEDSYLHLNVIRKRVTNENLEEVESLYHPEKYLKPLCMFSGQAANGKHYPKNDLEVPAPFTHISCIGCGLDSSFLSGAQALPNTMKWRA
jgi:hypothetical protein